LMPACHFIRLRLAPPITSPRRPLGLIAQASCFAGVYGSRRRPLELVPKFGARRVRIRLRRCSRSQRIPERSGPDRCRNPDRRLDDPPACDRRQRYTRRRERAGDDHRWRRDEHAPHGEVLTTQPHLMERQPLPHEETGFQRGVGSWESAQSSHESTA